MRKINFLIKLKKEGKLKVIEPNSNVKESYIEKSGNSLKSAEILLQEWTNREFCPNGILLNV